MEMKKVTNEEKYAVVLRELARVMRNDPSHVEYITLSAILEEVAEQIQTLGQTAQAQ